MHRILIRLLFGLLFTVYIQAQEEGTRIRNRLEIGAGAIQSDVTEAVVRIEAQSTVAPSGSSGGSYYVLVRFKGETTLPREGTLSYVDIEAHFLGFGYDSGTDSPIRGYADLTLLNVNYQRNLVIDQVHQYGVSVLGVRGGIVVGGVNSQVQFFAEAAVDFASVAFDVQRASDGVALSPESFGSRAHFRESFEVGVNLFKRRVRVAIGGNILYTGAVGEQVDGPVVCTNYTYYDEYTGIYYEEQDCGPTTSTHYNERWASRRKYLDLSVKVSKALKVFGRAEVRTFSMEDDTGYFIESRDTQWMFQAGVSWSINNQRRKP